MYVHRGPCHRHPRLLFLLLLLLLPHILGQWSQQLPTQFGVPPPRLTLQRRGKRLNFPFSHVMTFSVRQMVRQPSRLFERFRAPRNRTFFRSFSRLDARFEFFQRLSSTFFVRHEEMTVG